MNVHVIHALNQECYELLRFSLFQLVIKTKSGELVDRLSPWANYVVQPGDKTFDQVFWSPEQVWVRSKKCNMRKACLLKNA